jgi:hypothetical protein
VQVFRDASAQLKASAFSGTSYDNWINGGAPLYAFDGSPASLALFRYGNSGLASVQGLRIDMGTP